MNIDNLKKPAEVFRVQVTELLADGNVIVSDFQMDRWDEVISFVDQLPDDRVCARVYRPESRSQYVVPT